MQVHWYFSKYIPDWTFENWTSKLRDRKYPPFTESEKDHSDFTYKDTAGHMGKFLAKKGRRLGLSQKVLGRWTSSPEKVTYHFEVKSTPFECNATFYVSENQVQWVSLNSLVSSFVSLTFRVSTHPSTLPPSSVICVNHIDGLSI